MFKWRPIKYNPKQERLIVAHTPKPRCSNFILYEQLLRDAEKYHDGQKYEVSQQILNILKTTIDNGK